MSACSSTDQPQLVALVALGAPAATEPALLAPPAPPALLAVLGRTRLRSAVRATQLVQKLTAESEGTDMHYVNSVPRWVHYTRIAGCRYRYVYKVRERIDGGLVGHRSVSVYGEPGVPGWAAEIGPVAILYTGAGPLLGAPAAAARRRWFVFRKLLPFAATAAERERAPLLLGTDLHVRQTPREVAWLAPAAADAGVVGPGGATAITRIEPPRHAHHGDTVTATMLVADAGGHVSIPIARLSPHARYRLWLAWSHPESAHAAAVAPLRIARGVDGSLRGVAVRLERAMLSCLGFDALADSWEAQPYAQVEPAFYEAILTAVAALRAQRKQLRADALAERAREGGGEAARGDGAGPEGGSRAEADGASDRLGDGCSCRHRHSIVSVGSVTLALPESRV